jgi:hypothetical protein
VAPITGYIRIAAPLERELEQVLAQVVETVADSRNQPSFDTARTDAELLKARDGCVSPRTRRWLGATR